MLLNQQLLGAIDVDSAGTIGVNQGKSADARMQYAASNRGYELHSQSRRITPADFREFDLIVCMDRENLSDCKRIVVEELDSQPNEIAELKLLSDFLDENSRTDVPDPYRGGTEGFELVMDMIEEACPAIIKYLK